MKKSENSPMRIVIAVLLFLMLLLIIFYWRSYKSEANEIADAINKGNALMEASCYKEAIECYEFALSKEPDNEKIVYAIINAYMLMGESEGESDEAILAYLTAIAIRPNNRSAYWAIADIYESRGDEQNMVDILQRGLEDTQDPNMEKKIARTRNEKSIQKSEDERLEREEAQRKARNGRAATMLSPLVTLFQDEDYDSLMNMLNEQRYIDFSDEIVGNNFYYYGGTDSHGRYNGTGLAAYPNGFFYYGDFYDDERSGYGVWFKAVYPENSSKMYYLFEGTWEDNYPNGEGRATSQYYPDRIESGFATEVIEGDYVDGLEEGQMKLTGTTKTGRTREFLYTAMRGIAEKIDDTEESFDEYIIARTDDQNVSLTSDGSIRCVEGFDKRIDYSSDSDEIELNDDNSIFSNTFDNNAYDYEYSDEYDDDSYDDDSYDDSYYEDDTDDVYNEPTAGSKSFGEGEIGILED